MTLCGMTFTNDSSTSSFGSGKTELDCVVLFVYGWDWFEKRRGENTCVCERENRRTRFGKDECTHTNTRTVVANLVIRT